MLSAWRSWTANVDAVSWLAPARLPRRRLDIGDLVDGTLHQTPAGSCFVGERVFPLDHRHGAHRLGEALAAPAAALALMARDPEVRGLDPRESVFLDTETTGLSGGTGTYVFLVGVGRFEGEAFVVRQVFMRDYAEEPALLHALDELCSSARTLVTFNGRVFDWPLLETRYLLALRARPRLRPLAHLDLLHPARRLWRGRLESCSLGSLERWVLGHRREDDVPGWAIPSLYFNYLRHGDCLPLRQVFRHNLHDVLSLAALVARLGQLLWRPLDAASSAEELLAVGRLYEEAGWDRQAVECFEYGLRLEAPAATRATLLARLATLHKRAGRAQLAIERWRELARLGHGDDVGALVELAKHFEHRQRDYQEAIDLVQQALAIVELRALRGREPTAGLIRRELERRLARLLRKASAARGTLL